LLYKKQNVDRIMLYKRLIKLRATIIFKKVSSKKQIDIKENLKNIIINKRVEKELYNNAFKYIGNSGRDALYELILLRLLYRDDIGSSAPSLLALTYLGNLNYL